jgi:hypothetical protein
MAGDLPAANLAVNSRPQMPYPPDGFWLALFSTETGNIDPSAVSIGEHRDRLARKNIKAWLEDGNLPYHTPHKFRHGHIHYGSAPARAIEDFNAVSMNVMHSSMKITDEFYSNLSDAEIKRRIDALTLEKPNILSDDSLMALLKDFLIWRASQGKLS